LQPVAGPQIVDLVLDEGAQVVGGGRALGPDRREYLVGDGGAGVRRRPAVDELLAGGGIPGVALGGAELVVVGAIESLQRRDVEHHEALRRGAVDGRGRRWDRRAEIARVGHYREFVVVEVRSQRAVQGAFVAG